MATTDLYWPRGRGAILLGGIVLAVAVSAIGYVLLLAQGHPGRAIADLLFLASSLTAAFYCLRAAGRLPRLGTSWRWFGAGCLAWSTGRLIWMAHSLSAGSVAYPSLAEFGFLLFFPCFFIGLALIVRDRQVGPPAGEVILDSLLAVAMTGVLGYRVLLRPLFDQPEVDSLAMATTITWQVATMGLLVMMAVALLWHRDVLSWRSLVVLMGGILLFGTASVVYGGRALAEGYSTGHPVDLGWHGGFILIALAAHLAPDRGAIPAPALSEELTRRMFVWWRATAIVVSVLAFTGLAVAAAVAPGRGWFTAVAAAVIGVLVAARLILAVAQSDRLIRRTRERDRLAAVVDTSAAIAGTLDMNQVLRKLATAAAMAADRERAEVTLVGARGRVGGHATHGLRPHDQAALDGHGMMAVATARRQQMRRPIVIQWDREPALPAAAAAAFRAFDKRQSLVAPLIAHDEVIGFVDLWSPGDVVPFASEDLAAAAAIGRQGGLAIANAWLLEETRLRAEEQAALLRVSQAVISEVGLQTVLQEISRASLGVAGTECFEVELWLPETDETELVAQSFSPDWKVAARIGRRLALADWPVTRRILTTREPLAFDADASFLTDRERQILSRYGTGSVLMVPIQIAGACLGALNLYSRTPNAFPPRAVRLAEDLASQAALAIERARLHEALAEQARTDGLTGLLNHRAILELLDDALKHSLEAAQPLAVLMIDLDNFKLFNDTYGHLVGDRILRDAAVMIRDSLPADGHVGRYGGDEFLILLMNQAGVDAGHHAERILSHVAERAIAVTGQELPLKLSIGLAVTPTDGATSEDLIMAADRAMYTAKQAGGVVATPDQIPHAVESSSLEALAGLVRAVDRKDHYTRVHSDLVTAVVALFGRHLDLPPARIEALEIAGQLHDIGKIAVPDAILRKPGPLTAEEGRILAQHVVFSEQMVKGVPHQDDVIAAIAHHHERWDGQGYPHGTRGDAIPLLGRILALADAYAAMTYDRPYRKARMRTDVISELRAGAGSQFDPALVERFIAFLPTLSDRLSLSTPETLETLA